MLERLEDRTVPSSIGGLSPTSGPVAGGSGVLVYGSGFTNASSLTFGGVSAAYFYVVSDTMIMASTPAHAAGVVDAVVTAPSGTSQITSADHYTYLASDPFSTTTTLTSSANPSTSGQAVTFTATVSNGGHGTPTGTVTFDDGPTAIGTGVLSTGGQATLTTTSLTVGSHPITAVYGGDANDAGSTSSMLNQTVNNPLSSVWTVVNTFDLGQGNIAAHTGDLRFRLTNAGTGDTIFFNIPGTRVQTIVVTRALPTINAALMIDGFTQGGGSSSGPLVQINGNGGQANGLDAEAGGVTIEDLAIYGFAGNGVVLNNPYGSAGDTLMGGLIGTDTNGDANVGNTTGVLVEGPNDTVGAIGGAPNTIVSGNTQDGIDVSGANAANDLITNVWVGIGLTGLTPLGNGGNGISLMAASNATTVAAGVISGNQKDGISSVAPFSTIKGCTIGVAADGTTKAANKGNGVSIKTAGGCIVGVAGPSWSNIIAGNGAEGLLLSDSSSDLVVNNYIGLDKFGALQGNGQHGVLLLSDSFGGVTTNNTIGGATPLSRNVISGNGTVGLGISGPATNQNLILGNYIGTNVAGTAAIPNGSGLEVVSKPRPGSYSSCELAAVPGDPAMVPLVSDELWDAIAPLLPDHPRPPKGGRPRLPDRPCLNGVVFVLREGLRWQSLPSELGWGSGSTCHRRFAEWTAAGVWEKAHLRLVAALGERGLLNLERAVVDSSSLRALRGGEHTGPNPTDRAKKGCKRHLITDAHGVPLVVQTGPANRRDEQWLPCLLWWLWWSAPQKVVQVL